jgi:Fic/DOC family protein
MTYHHKYHIDFIRESNRIEGVKREPTEAEADEFYRFMGLNTVSAKDMVEFVKVYQPNAQLRNRAGLDVMVGGYYPPKGSPMILGRLESILEDAHSPKYGAYKIHQAYEELHPFTDGNGRSGRMLWMWMMGDAPLGFLHTWYYQSLSNNRPSDVVANG